MTKIPIQLNPVKLLGVPVHPSGVDELNSHLSQIVLGRTRGIIGSVNLHSLYLCHKDPKMRNFYAIADCSHVDGMGVVLLARLLGVKIARDQRVTYLDWMPSLLQMAATRGFRVFYLGSKPGIADKAAERFRQCYPGLLIETAHGHFDPNGVDNDVVLDTIREFAPNIVMVGMGQPRQERWVLDNAHKMPGITFLTPGAAFDYYAGVVPTPPRWAGRLGLEWLFRLLAEPSRLWKRYLFEPWLLLAMVARYWATAAHRTQSSD